MIRNVLPPEPTSPSVYGIGKEIEKRASELPGMCSILVKDLVQEANANIIDETREIKKIRELTERSLERIDMAMIKKGASVNILASHHSFTIFGGTPYVALLKAIKDVIKDNTGVKDIRLRVGGGLRFREPEELIKRFELEECFDGKAVAIAPVDKGIPIETSIGTLYGIERAYDADWIVHTHNTSMREVHFHRFVDRILKPFSMAYARLETRSIFHHNFGPRGANLVSRAIADSEFIKDKLAFSTILKCFPVGIVGVDSDNDLKRQSDQITAECLREYGKVLHLLGKIDSSIAILDCPAPIPYASAGGIMFANFVSNNIDQFDLDNPVTPYSYFTEMAFDQNNLPIFERVPACNPAIKVVINNYSFRGYPSTFFAQRIPTIVVGNKMANLLRTCPQNSDYMSNALLADNLGSALEFAYKVAGTKNVIIFDGARVGFNGSPSLIDFLRGHAKEASQEVISELLPKWLKQRGISEATKAEFVNSN